MLVRGSSCQFHVRHENSLHYPESLSSWLSLAGWLEPVVAYVLQAGMGQARAEIFRKQIIQHGGRVHSQFSSDLTHIILDEGMDCDRAFRLLRLAKLSPGLQLVKASWLSSCVAEQKMLSTTGYSLFIPDK